MIIALNFIDEPVFPEYSLFLMKPHRKKKTCNNVWAVGWPDLSTIF
jgi:hypothetical protein